jgi:hypothetical protein
MTPLGAITIAVVLAGAPLAVSAQAAAEKADPKKHDEPETAGGDKPSYSSAEVADAPAPDATSGVARGPDRSGEWALWIPRVLLFPVRAVAEVVGWPIRKGIYAYQVYDLKTRIKSIFFNEEGTAGLFPVAFSETGFGLNVGARLVLRELLDTDFKLNGRASFGGRFRQIYSLKLSSGETFDRLSFELAGIFELRPKDLFFGIGNGELSDEEPAMPLDPIGADAVRSRFRQRALRGVLTARYAITPRLSALLSAAVNDRTYNDSDEGDRADDEVISENFDTAGLTGFDQGSRHVYVEAELTYDSRRRATPWEPAPLPSTGWKLAGFGGYAFAIDDSSSGYARYGLDLQRYFRIADGPRLLAFRVLLEGVSGAYDEVPFYDLPQLGGSILLRGYDIGRFRDRIAAIGSAEYQFDLSNRYMAGFVFADAGRVYSTLDDVALDGLNLGFGGGVQAHTQFSFQGRLTLASSINGGFFAFLTFDTIYDPKARVERR